MGADQSSNNPEVKDPSISVDSSDSIQSDNTSHAPCPSPTTNNLPLVNDRLDQTGTPIDNTVRINREITRMNETMIKKLKSGAQYNMKIIIRGERASGKSMLLKRLQGQGFSKSRFSLAILIGVINMMTQLVSRWKSGMSWTKEYRRFHKAISKT